MKTISKPEDAETFFDLFLGFYNRVSSPSVSQAYRMAAMAAADMGMGTIPLARIRKTLRQISEVDGFRSVRGRK